MFFSKKLKGAPAQKHRVSFNLDFNKTRGAFLKQRNVAKVGDKLFSAFGVIQSPYTETVDRALFQIGDYFVALANGLGVVSYNSGQVLRLADVTSDSTVSHVKYQDKIVFSTDSGTYVTDSGDMSERINDNYYTSLATCYSRIFGISGKDICMTLAGDISQWDDSLVINADTKLDALIALDKLYVLGDTCYTLVPNAEECNMQFKPFAFNVGAVQAESVTALGKRAIFASTNGLYKLTSNSITPIFTQLYDYVSFDGCVACEYNGKLCITCKRRDGDMTKNDILLVLDVDREQIDAVLDVEAQHIATIDGKLYMVVNNKLCMASDEIVESSYVETVDFHSGDVKYLDKLTVRTLTDVDIWIDNGREKRRYCVRGKHNVQRLPLAGSGRQFDVVVHAHDGMQLDCLELTARTYGV